MQEMPKPMISARVRKALDSNYYWEHGSEKLEDAIARVVAAAESFQKRLEVKDWNLKQALDELEAALRGVGV